MSDIEDIPIRAVAWKPSYRLIASRYPTVGLYDAIADPAAAAAKYEANARVMAVLRKLGQGRGGG